MSRENPNLQVVILAGGYGSRISEETLSKPKPLIEIGGIPLIVHIINIFIKQKFKEFIICTGYKGEQFNNFFANYNFSYNDLEVNLKNNSIEYFKKNNEEIKIKIIHTGINTNTGGRILKIKKFIKKDCPFLYTYGDGLSDINLQKLLKFHKQQKKIATISLYNYIDRFGVVKIKNNLVNNFYEKPKYLNRFINIGFGVLNYEIFKILKKNHILEKNTLKILAKKKQLAGFIHKKNFFAMDSLRDKQILEKNFNKNPFWIK